LIVTNSSTGHYHVHGPLHDKLEIKAMICAIRQQIFSDQNIIQLDFSTSTDKVPAIATGRRLLLIDEEVKKYKGEIKKLKLREEKD
jgi:hypothetical protein